MTIQALLETINGFNILLKGRKLNKAQVDVLSTFPEDDLEDIANSLALEIELRQLMLN